MPRSRKDIRSLLAIFGVVILLATTVITLGTIRPTEAQWADEVLGTSTFSAEENVGNHYSRALSTYGTFSIPSSTEQIGPAHEFDTSRTNPTPAPFGSRTVSFSDRGFLSLLNMTVSGASCARSGSGHLSDCPGGAPSAPSGAVSFASASASDLAVRTTLFPLARYPGTLRTTASCTPGQDGETSVIKNGDFTLEAGLGSTDIEIPEATGSDTLKSNTDSRRGLLNAYYYTATITHQREIGVGYAKSDLYLDLRAGASLGGSERWHLVINLASAECGVNRPASTLPDRPNAQDGIPRAMSPSARTTEGAMAPLVADVELDSMDPDSSGEASASGESAEDTEVETDEARSELPSLDDARQDAVLTPSPNPTATTSRSTTSATATPTTTEPDAQAPTTSAPASGVAEPTTSTATSAGPQRPQDVRVGREFAVVTREGVDLGTARIEDVRRLPDCGVEITLEITTSAEDGPERWASIDHRDFAEVRPGGSTRPAQRTGSECASGAAAGPAQLRVGGVHEVVVVIQISDTADRAIFRPEGTAGWRFDLPPLPTTTPTTTVTTTATSTTAAASPSTALATPQASASPQDAAVTSDP